MEFHFDTEARRHEIREEPLWQHANNATGRERSIVFNVTVPAVTDLIRTGLVLTVMERKRKHVPFAEAAESLNCQACEDDLKRDIISTIGVFASYLNYVS
jgi:hypothetical protein